jgi:threonine/homoserine efflux transporter RhtA
VLLWVVVMGTLLPFGLELVALRHLPASTVTMLAMVEPVGVNILGWVWFYESLDAVALVGGVAVVAGIVLAQSARHPVVMARPPQIT